MFFLIELRVSLCVIISPQNANLESLGLESEMLERSEGK